MLQQLATEVRIPVMSAKPEAGATENFVTINGRYGEVTLNLEKAIFFPRGLLGLSQFKDFGITDMPNKKLSQFKLLQSLNDSQLSFVVLPINAENPLIDAEDIEECSRVTAVPKKDLLFLLIVTAQQMPDNSLKVTANVRAPIVIDTENRNAIQYVFANNKYNIQHPLV